MPIIKFNVSDVDQDDATKVYAPPPPPGMYKAKIRQCKLGYKKVNGKMDMDTARLEIVYETDDAEHGSKGGWVYEYIQLAEDAHEVVKKKYTAFLVATGNIKGGKATGQFDPEKQEGKQVYIRVRPGKNLEGAYKADPGGVWALNHPGISASSLGVDKTWAGHNDPDRDRGEYTPSDGPFDDDATAQVVEDTDVVEGEEEDGVELADLCAAADEGDEDAGEALQGWWEAEVGGDPDPGDYALWSEWYDALVEAGIVEPGEDEPEAEAEDEPAEPAEYSSMSIPELKAACAERGLKDTGTKSQLIARLEGADAEEPF
jgi:hypothetical protein